MVSVIIPVFNVAPYLSRCVQSLMEQSYADLEIILVDDGSTDGSGILCDELARDDRITVVHKINGGVSSARNEGIKIASGEWIRFVDADDLLPRDSLLNQVSCAVQNNSDVVFSDYQLMFNDRIDSYSLLFHEDSNEYLKIYIDSNSTYVWNILVSRKWLINTRCKFDIDLSVGEDLLFVAELLSENPRISHDKNSSYLYNKTNQQSVTSRQDILFLRKKLHVYEKLHHLFKSDQSILDAVYRKAAFSLQDMLLHNDLLEECYRLFRHRHILYLTCENISWRVRLYYFLLSYGVMAPIKIKNHYR